MLISQILYQKQGYVLAVDVFIKIKQVRFDANIFAIHRGPYADVANHFETLVFYQTNAGINAKRRDEFVGVVDVDVCSGESNGSAQLLAMNHRTSQLVWPANELICLV